MGLVNVSDLKPGMVVLSEVSNKHSNVLLKKGDSLTEKNIVLLKSWGITEIDIATVENQQSGTEENAVLSPETMESIEQEIKERALLYVAATRAKQTVLITSSGRPSHFLF